MSPGVPRRGSPNICDRLKKRVSKSVLTRTFEDDAIAAIRVARLELDGLLAPQTECNCRLASVKIRSRSACEAWLPSRLRLHSTQRIRQIVHRKLLLSCSVLSSIRSVLLPTRRSETPVRDKGQVTQITCCRKCGFRRTPCGESGRRDARDNTS
jgi:hypothetical protein